MYKCKLIQQVDMESGKTPSRHPQENANFVSRLFMWWIIPLLWKGWRRPLQQDDLHPVRDKDKSCTLTKRLEEKWEQEKESAKKEKRACMLWKAMLRYFNIQDYLTYLGCFSVLVVGQNISWYSLISLLRLVSDLSFEEAESNIQFHETALVYVYGMMLGFLMEAFGLARFNLHGARLGNKAKSGVMGLLYKKVLKLSKMAINSGHVMELICNDSQRLLTSGEWYIPVALRHVLCVGNTIAWLFYFIGWQIVPGALFLVMLVVLRMLFSNVDYDLRKKASELSEKRLGYIRESLTVIHSVKVNCWEKIFEEKIQKTRWKEVKLKSKRWIISLICYAFTTSGQSLATFITVCILIVTARNDIAGLNFFSMIYLFGILNMSIAISIPTAIRLFTDVRGALQRIEKFLKAVDKTPGKSLQSPKSCIEENITSEDLLKEFKPADQAPFVNLHNVTCQIPLACGSPHFSKPKSEGSILLKNISLEVSGPELVLICGAVGTGKSLLLETILGELLVTNGSINYCGKLAYVSESPWVFPGTIRENIVFGLPYNESKYDKIIKACQLEKDFDNFPVHDLTRIGENNTTISGGQRARLALARAVYSEADIYLLDDPLSSLDINVVENVFRDCVQGLLSDRIILLTTHATKYYPMADRIVQLGEGGVILNQGSYETFKTALPLNGLVEDDASLKDRIDQREIWGDNREFVESANLEKEEEERKSGRVSLKVYLEYLLHGASPFIALIVPVLYFSGAGLIVLVDITASQLPRIAKDGNSRFRQVFHLYIIYFIFAVFLTAVGTLGIFLLFMNSAYKVHNKMVACLMKAPLSFYARNPVGRILNRLSQDINILDESLPYYAYVTVNCISPVISTLLLASMTNPWLILSFLLSMPLFYIIGSIYIASSTDIKRLMLMAAGPIYSHFSNTLEGLKTIRVHSRQEKYMEQVFRHIDNHSAAVLPLYTSSRCFGIIFCGLNTLVAGIITMVIIFSINDITTATLGAITILYALKTNTFVKVFVRFAADINTQMTSAERAVAFTQIPPESGQNIPKFLPKEWPSAGRLEFQDVSLWHYKGGPKVLKNISFKVNPREKIGIAGRTGAGKSSLVAALMRLALTEGDIYVDGLNIREINVAFSRQVISVISQSPILISGTIRVNLDPLGEHSDSEIWNALALTKMTSAISNLPKRLESEINSSDSNFSLGERQLLHLTRVLLKKNKIIIFDEATGKVDRKTDEDIQSIVREVFKDCTVITIAHRLSTILDSDRIMILDQGKIVDCDRPQALLNKEDSLLKQLIELSSEN